MRLQITSMLPSLSSTWQIPVLVLLMQLAVHSPLTYCNMIRMLFGIEVSTSALESVVQLADEEQLASNPTLAAERDQKKILLATAMYPVVHACSEIYRHMIELEAGIALRIYQGDDAATPTVASTLAYAHDMVSKSFNNAPSFLALADEALAYKSFRFERLAIDHDSALSMLEHAHVLIRSCWLRYARIMILAGESEIVGAGSDDGVIASCRRLEYMRSIRARLAWEDDYAKRMHSDTAAAGLASLKRPGAWMRKAMLDDEPKPPSFECSLPLRLRFPIGVTIEAHGLSSRKDLNGKRGTVVAHDESRGRVSVRFWDSAATVPLAIKLSNLRTVLDDA